MDISELYIQESVQDDTSLMIFCETPLNEKERERDCNGKIKNSGTENGETENGRIKNSRIEDSRIENSGTKNGETENSRTETLNSEDKGEIIFFSLRLFIRANLLTLDY